MFHPDELRGKDGKWTAKGLLEHGITIKSAGRTNGNPSQAVYHKGVRIGHVESTGRGFKAHTTDGAIYAVHPTGRAKAGQGMARDLSLSSGHGSIAEAAAHIAAAHPDVPAPKGKGGARDKVAGGGFGKGLRDPFANPNRGLKSGGAPRAKLRGGRKRVVEALEAAGQDPHGELRRIMEESVGARSAARAADKAKVEGRLDEAGFLKIADHSSPQRLLGKLKRGNTVKVRGYKGQERIIVKRTGDKVTTRDAAAGLGPKYHSSDRTHSVSSITHVRMSQRYARPGG